MSKLKTAMAASALVAASVAPLPASAMEPFLGQIQFFGFNFTPRGWAACDGQLLPISSNTALFALLGTIYGGDGRNTFALPDARGRVLIHQGRGAGLPAYPIGSKGGSTTNTLNTSQLPPHAPSVSLRAGSATGNTGTPSSSTVLAGVNRGTNYSTAAPDVSMSATSISVGSVGRGQPVNNMQPYLTVNCQIALQGIFPSRN